METQELKRIVEALIFAADAPLSAERILETLELKNGFALGALIDELNSEYQQSGRAFTIRQVAGGYQIVTQSQYANWIKKLYLGRQKTRLSQAALETLALVAFKQPISRVEIAQIRGVNSDGVIGTLLERKLITISGRSEAVGRPLLYSTTPEFLKYFGLNDIADLPKPREIEELFSKEGLPEELLHALSQEDPQLSLPINADAATVSEDLDNKTAPSVDPSSPAFVAIPLPVNRPQEIFSSERDETPAAEPSPATTDPEPESIPLDINEEVVTLLDDSNDPESLNDDPANDSESAPIAADEQKVISTPEDAGSTSPLQDEPSPASSSEDKPKTGPMDDASNMNAASGDFDGVDTWVDQRDKISPVTLAAGVEELFQIPPESPSGETEVVEVRASDNITVISNATLGETPFVLAPANDDLFATVDEIALIGEIDKTDKANGAFEADDPTSHLKSAAAFEIDGWLAEEFSREEIAEPGIFEDFNTVVSDSEATPLDGSASGIEPIAKSRPDALSLALRDFPDLAEVETKIEKASPASASAPLEGEVTRLQPEESAAVEFISAATAAPSEEVTSWQAEVSPPVEFISVVAPAPAEGAALRRVEASPLVEANPQTAAAASEDVTSLPAEMSPSLEFNPETAPVPLETDTSLHLEAPLRAAPLAEAAPEISERSTAMSADMEIPAGQENTTTDTNSTEQFSAAVFSGESSDQTPALAAVPMITTGFAGSNSGRMNEQADNRWTIFREKTVGWIKRTFDKLMALVGARS